MPNKKKYLKWSDYERALVVAHHRKFGVANKQLLSAKMPYRTYESVSCELDKFNNWITTGVMEYCAKAKYRAGRAGVREIYTTIINELYL